MQPSTDKSRPAYQQAYEVLRDMILQGTLSPGTKLVEEKPATDLNVSRTPIIEEHHQICEAIKAHDGQTAERLMKEHLQSDLEFCLHLIR